MRPLYNDFDDFEFGDVDLVARIMREQDREERRLANKRRRGAARKHKRITEDDYEDVSDVEVYDEFDDYDEYDDDEFDAYSGVDTRGW